MNRNHLVPLLALSALAASAAEPELQRARRRTKFDSLEPDYVPSAERRRYGDLGVELRHEAQRRELPRVAATPQPGPVKGKRKLSRAERKREKAKGAKR